MGTRIYRAKVPVSGAAAFMFPRGSEGTRRRSSSAGIPLHRTDDPARPCGRAVDPGYPLPLLVLERTREAHGLVPDPALAVGGPLDFRGEQARHGGRFGPHPHLRPSPADPPPGV